MRVLYFKCKLYCEFQLCYRGTRVNVMNVARHEAAAKVTAMNETNLPMTTNFIPCLSH